MAIVRIELTAGDDDDRRRRQQRTAKALIILAGLIVLAFAAPEPAPKPDPVLRLAPLVTDFGSQNVGSPSAKIVLLHNAEPAPFVIAGIVAEGPTQGDFSVDAARCRRIEPGADCLAVVSFNPRAAGSQSATFHIAGAANATSQTFVARGVGTELFIPPPPPPQPPRPPAQPVVVQPPPPPPPPTPEPQPVQTITPPTPPTETVPVEETTTTADDTTTEEAPAATSTEAPATRTTTTEASPAKERDHTKDALKRLGRIAGALVIGGIIAHETHGHADRQPSDPQTQRRIDVP